jgi:hypothetical protein
MAQKAPPPRFQSGKAKKTKWTVIITKPEGEGVGLLVDSGSSRVLHVQPGGYMDRHNKNNPTRAVRKGDTIISANDKYSASEMQPGGEMYEAETVALKVSRNVERLRWLQGLALKNLSMDEAELMLTTFEMLDNDETSNKQPDGHLMKEKAFIWFRVLGYVWTDDELHHNLNMDRGIEQFTCAELLRTADQHYDDRYRADRDAEKVAESFKVFETEKDQILRADIYKELAKCKLGTAECNLWLDTLGYPGIQLSINTRELVERITDCLGELPKIEAMTL